MSKPRGSQRSCLACAFFEQETLVRATVEALFDVCCRKCELGSNLLPKTIKKTEWVAENMAARNKANIKIRQPLAELAFTTNDDDVFNFVIDQQQVVLDELNIKKIKRVEHETQLIKYIVKPNLPLLGQKYGSDLKTIKVKLTNIDQDDLLKQIRNKNKYEIELEDQVIFLGRDDLIFISESTDGYTSSGDDNFTVGLTIELTEDLVQEGIVRDIIRHVQTMRKNANFAVEDRIKIYSLLEGTIGDAISSFETLFKNEVLAVDIIKESKTGEYSENFKIGNQNIQFGIERI